jgi:hypothetical protein
MPEYVYVIRTGKNGPSLAQAEIMKKGEKQFTLKKTTWEFEFRTRFPISLLPRMSSPRVAWEYFRDRKAEQRVSALHAADVAQDDWAFANRKLDQLTAQGE